MIELKSVMPSLDYDLRYATNNNFTKKQLYKNGKTTFLRSPAAEALKKAQQELATKGYGLKIFDAYRPYSATKKMWDLIHDERYVANPTKGSGHNRGLSVDLTLIDLKTGKELDLGTGFDNFSDSAGHAFSSLPADVLQNRKLLKETMEKFGFKPLQTEWWHYSWPNDRNYEVLDIDFKKLRKEHD
jgi:D-alanyl-D-alanine dipeptidase